MSWRSVLLGCVMLCVVGLSPLLAEETHYVTRGDPMLNMRSGPGMEYSVVSRLPYGTKVVLHERWGQWAKILLLQGKQEGWVIQHYLAPASSADKKETDMSRQQERRRFARLQRKGVITVVRSHMPDTLRLTINHLVWRHLTPSQQQNFLRRAKRHFGGTVVEMRDRRNNALLARLTALGEMEGRRDGRIERQRDRGTEGQ